ncbi:phasin protein [Cupriavidus gilardii J11]|uniref:Phasin protein n=1 Tax=Cupriavidus gilardii J11 TaxID=936133 RepID=A0A562B7G6_9BURK|nr:hypothetical protein [Cupriavidus gilardii]TWG81127.1 phasin protein [Cupriavidus gilardii J11]
MPATTDMPFALTRTALENTLRGLALIEETQQQFIRLQLKAADDALNGSQAAMTEINGATDWSSLGALPGLMLRQNIERNAGLMQNCMKLMADTQSAWLATMRETSESLQRCQAAAMASGGAAAAGFPMQAMADRFNEMTQATTQAATTAAAQATQAAQGAARNAKRGDHAN